MDGYEIAYAIVFGTIGRNLKGKGRTLFDRGLIPMTLMHGAEHEKGDGQLHKVLF